MNQPKNPDNERPISITIICIINFIVIPIFIFLLIYGLSLPDLLQEFSSQEIQEAYLLQLWLIILLILTIGLWRMKRWGAYGYLGSFVLSLFYDMSIDDTLPADASDLRRLVTQGLVAYFILKNLPKMS